MIVCYIYVRVRDSPPQGQETLADDEMDGNHRNRS
jgi:hypothetical protein